MPTDTLQAFGIWPRQRLTMIDRRHDAPRTQWTVTPQQFVYVLPLPHRQESRSPTIAPRARLTSSPACAACPATTDRPRRAYWRPPQATPGGSRLPSSRRTDPPWRPLDGTPPPSLSQIHRRGTHRSSCISARRSTTTAQVVQGLFEKCFRDLSWSADQPGIDAHTSARASAWPIATGAGHEAPPACPGTVGCRCPQHPHSCPRVV